MADLKKLAEEIVGLTLLEAQELKTILKDEYGIEPAAGGAVMMAAPAGGDAGGADRKSTRLNFQSHSDLVCRLLLEKKKKIEKEKKKR